MFLYPASTVSTNVNSAMPVKKFPMTQAIYLLMGNSC